MKYVFLNSCRTAEHKKELSISERQAIMKLIEEKDKYERLIKNWRPVSLLNIDYKIICKALAARCKKSYPNLISLQQMTYVQKKIIDENGRLIADITEITDIINKKEVLATMDIEKPFYSLDHALLISVLKNLDLVIILFAKLKFLSQNKSLA